MTAIPQLTIETRRPEPAVWVSRLLILESVEPWKEIRDIPLHRGLNIVWSVDLERDDETAPVMTGHGVGKTTFCRLLRYCLGEATFGHKSLVQRIRTQLPSAVVGAVVHVGGVAWAVVRPLGRTHGSFAQQGTTIEQMLSEKPSPRSFQEFKDALTGMALNNGLSDRTLSGNRPILWDHVLAWCARDQEARYQNLWEWRSPRSDSETPAFTRPRQDAMFLVRAALGLVGDDEVSIQRRLLTIDERLKELVEQIKDRQREPEFQIHRLRRELVSAFEIAEAEQAPITQTDLFSLPALVSRRQADLSAEETRLTDQLAEINRRLLAVQVSIQDAEQISGEWQAATDTTEAGSETFASSAQQRRDDRKRLDEIAGGFCKYGGVTFGECSYVKDRALQLDSLIQVETQQAAGQVSHRDQISAEMRDAAGRAAERVKQLNSERDSLLLTKGQVERLRGGLEQKSKALGRALASLVEWDTFMSGESGDPTLKGLNYESESLNTEQETKKQELTVALVGQSQRLGALQRVFSGCVSEVLSSEFIGAARFREGEVECSITHGSVLAGEAVETLAVLLTDLTCLLLGAELNCRHPGIHIHDSPREADLGLRIYRRFLNCVGKLHEALGGNEAAPFQYVLTTTTAPPLSLQSDKYVVLRLSNERDDQLVLRRSLGAPIEPPQQSLFETTGG